MSNLTYAFAIGPDELERQAKWLLQSIHANTAASADDIVAFMVSDEADQISDDSISFFEDNSTLVEGKMPNPEYPLSAAHAALEAATSLSNHEYTLLLDTDTVVLDDISVHEGSTSDLLLAPAFVATTFWADRDRSESAWQELYETYGFDEPEISVRSLVDDVVIGPYFNGGVIFARSESNFSHDWLELSKEVHGELPRDNYYSEMVSLSLLTSKYSVSILSQSYNHPQKCRFKPASSDVNILHYVDPLSLYRAMNNPKISHRLSSTSVGGYFEDQNRIRFGNQLLRSYAKAYQLEHPQSVLGRLIGSLITLQHL